MTEFELADQDIRSLQQWLREAWQQLADPELTPYSRRELRNQMKQRNAELRSQLAAVEQSRPKLRELTRTFAEPSLRFLA
jgi:hypothetical protein